MFDAIAALVKDGTLNRNTLELGSEGSIQKFIKGEIPVIVCISYYAKEFKNTAFTAVSDYTMPNGAQGNIPIICNAIMCVPISSKNGQQIEEFIKYALNDKTQKMLSAKGFITANKKANENLKGVSGVASWHIQNAGENSIVYLYNLPEKFKEPLYSKIQTLLSGKHTKNEWEEIIDEIYKK
jgi:ABC-type Fe3+ transport system substrate-binding protein